MKQVVLISLVLLSVINARAQSNWFDSLLIKVDTEELTLKEKIGAHHVIADIYAGYDMKNTYIYGMRGLELAQKAKDKRMVATFYRYIASSYVYRTSYDTAHIYQQMQIDIAEETRDNILLQQSYFGLANLYARQGKFLQAVENYQKSMTFYKGKPAETVTFSDLVADYEDSFRYYDTQRTYILCLGNAGECYRRLNNPERALIYLTEAMDIIEADSTIKFTPFHQVCRELGYVYFAQGDIHKAKEHFMKVLNDPVTVGIINESDCKEAMIKILIMEKDYDKALEYASDCLKLAELLGDPFIDVLAWNSYAEIYRAQGNYKDCESAAMKAWSIDSTSVDTAPVSAINIAYSNLHLGNTEKADYFFRRSIDFNEQKSSRNFQEAMANVEVKYETEKKEMRIASLEKDKQQYLLLGITGLLLVVALSIMLWQKIKNIQREKQLIATRSVMDGEMGERARIARDLHDRLSGNLSAVKIGLSDNKEPLHSICGKLDNCIEEVRRVSHNLMPVSLQFGIKVALADFAAQFPNVRFHFFGEERRFEERKEFVIYCCANELVNNSLRHSEAKKIDLQLIMNEKFISLTVQDDGCGFEVKNVVEGVGLRNIHDRVASCNGRIDMVSLPGQGTETTIELKTENI